MYSRLNSLTTSVCAELRLGQLSDASYVTTEAASVFTSPKTYSIYLIFLNKLQVKKDKVN